MKKFEKGELAEIILDVLLAAGFMTVAVVAPNAVQLFKYLKPRNTQDRAKINRAVARLEKKGYIKKKSSDSELFVLTKEGEKVAKKHQIDSMRIERTKKWDGKWHLVMLSVPENKLQARRAVNLALKKLGCAQYQKSVSITPFPCKKEIDFVGECFGVRENMRLVVATSLDGADDLKKTFDLK